MPWRRRPSTTATVLISARSSHITCNAPQPTTVPSAVSCATQNSRMSSYRLTVCLSSNRPDPTFRSIRARITDTSLVRACLTVYPMAAPLYPVTMLGIPEPPRPSRNHHVHPETITFIPEPSRHRGTTAPGDLMHGNVRHVRSCPGDGLMVDAPQTSEDAKAQEISWGICVGAVRIA